MAFCFKGQFKKFWGCWVVGLKSGSEGYFSRSSGKNNKGNQSVCIFMKTYFSMKYFPVVAGVLILAIPALLNAQPIWVGKSGRIDFQSDAPLEVIKASSTALRGALNAKDQSFAFSVAMESFQGFNSPLQGVHFAENYMETSKYPEATFKGRIIEETDLSRPGEYQVRAKGLLTIHGVAQERIIKVMVRVAGNVCKYSSTFTVPLADHAITIPKVVYQKIAEEIQVVAEGELTLKPSGR